MAVAVGGGSLETERQRVAGDGPVVEVRQRLALADQEQVDAAVVVEVAGRQAPPDPRDAPRGPGSVRDVDQTAVLAPDEELGGHGVGDERAEILDVTVGRCQVQSSIVVDVEQGDPESEPIPARDREPDGDGPVAEVATAQVAIEGRRLAVEVGDRQVGASVAVEIAARDPHSRLIPPVGVRRDAGSDAHLFEAKAAAVSEQVVRRRVVGHEEVDATVLVEVGGDDPEPTAVAIDDASGRRHVDEPAAVVAEQMIGPCSKDRGSQY